MFEKLMVQHQYPLARIGIYRPTRTSKMDAEKTYIGVEFHGLGADIPDDIILSLPQTADSMNGMLRRVMGSPEKNLDYFMLGMAMEEPK